MKTVVKYVFAKLLIVMFLALATMGVVELVSEITGHLDVQMEQFEGARSILIKQNGLMDIIPMPPEWEPCKVFHIPFEYREKYIVYFVPGEDGALQAQVYKKGDFKLVKTARVKWYSGEDYYCNSQPGKAEGILLWDAASSSQTLVVYTTGIEVGRYPVTSNTMHPMGMLAESSILKEGNYVILFPQENRFVLFSGDDFLLATGKVKNP